MKIIAIDMDGTLLGTNGQVSRRNLEALEAAEAAGIEIVIATGRRHSYAMHVLRDLHLHPDNALVSSNGTVIRTIGSTLLRRTHMDVDVARDLCAHMRDFRSTLVLTFDLVGPDGEDSRGALTVENFAKLDSIIERWVRANERYIAEVSPIEDSLDGDPPIQMMFCGTQAHMLAAQNKMTELPWVIAQDEDEAPGAKIVLHKTVYPERDLCILDVLPSGCSKASALRELATMRGISISDVMAIGDNWNDVPMLDAAGLAVVMANAPAGVKTLAHERGWTVGLSNDEDGVAAAIETILREANEPATMVV